MFFNVTMLMRACFCVLVRVLVRVLPCLGRQGIPLATAVGMALAGPQFGLDVGVSYNRKEAKVPRPPPTHIRISLFQLYVVVPDDPGAPSPPPPVHACTKKRCVPRTTAREGSWWARLWSAGGSSSLTTSSPPARPSGRWAGTHREKVIGTLPRRGAGGGGAAKTN